MTYTFQKGRIPEQAYNPKGKIEFRRQKNSDMRTEVKKGFYDWQIIDVK